MNLSENSEVFECLYISNDDDFTFPVNNNTETIYLLNCIFEGSFITFKDGNIKKLILNNCAFEDVSGFLIENKHSLNDVEMYFKNCLNPKDSFIEYKFLKSWRVKYGR